MFQGLEVTILTALMTFQDSNDVYHTPEASSSAVPRRGNSGNNIVPASPTVGPAPAPPPKPPKKLGIDRIAEIQALRGQFNEVTVEAEGEVEDYAAYCANLFQVFMVDLNVELAPTAPRMICFSSPFCQMERIKYPKFSKSSRK